LDSEAENQRKYAENDSRFKSSKVLKELLERSKQNKEKYTPCAPSHLPAETKLPDDDDLAAVFPLPICWN
jgi:hypothetical protein